MKYERFEQLPVWQSAIELARRVFLMTDDRSFRYKGDLANQLQRASTSVSNNVAEGFERGTTQELITFLYIARGSAGEVRSMLHLCEALPYFCHLKSEISNLKSLSESISRQLRAWADSLQNTGIRGQRYLTEATRAADEHKSRAALFWRQLDQFRAQAEQDPEPPSGSAPRSESPPPSGSPQAR